MTENEFSFCLLVAFFIGVAFGVLLMLIRDYRKQIKWLHEPKLHIPEDYALPAQSSHPASGSWVEKWKQEQPGDVGHDPQHDPGLKP
jgi:hypothetical protein